MSVIQVKCYLFPDDVTPSIGSVDKATEIRRFDLITKAAGGGFDGIYNQLRERISSSYGDLIKSKENIRTYWQDDENELVGFSTDLEMQYAIDLQTAIRSSKPYEARASLNQIFKVYISNKHEKQQRSDDQSGGIDEKPIHYGVVCDGCNGNIVGIRYKCAICRDYDLCSDCKSKGIHRDTEHAFTKVEKPTNWRGGHHWMGGRRNWGKCPYKQQQQQQTPGTGAPQFPFFGSIPLVNDPEQLKSFGENLKRFLDPFGIDVDYYVDSINRAASGGNNAPSAEAEKKESEKTSAAAASATAKDDPNKMDLDKESAEKQQQAASSSVMEDPLLVIADDASAAAAVVSKKPATPSAPSSSSSNESTSNHPFIDAANALKSMIEQQHQENQQQQQHPGFNYSPSGVPRYPHSPAPAPEPKKQTTAAAATESFVDESFNMIDVEKELKIIKAIEQLKQMGYTDENGWLTRLVNAKDGNINAVLDTLSLSKN